MMISMFILINCLILSAKSEHNENMVLSDILEEIQLESNRMKTELHMLQHDIAILKSENK
jgi:hypothetical protein